MVRCLLAAGLFACPAAANAACTVSSSGVAFGAYDPRSATADDSTGTISISCTAKPAAGAAISLSAGNSGSYTARRMVSGANNLTYNLYTTSARTTIWGNGTGGSSTVVYGGTTALTYSISVYGRVPALQNVQAGTYTDTLVITISF